MGTMRQPLPKRLKLLATAFEQRSPGTSFFPTRVPRPAAFEPVAAEGPLPQLLVPMLAP